MLTEAQEQQILADLASVTDRLDMLDNLVTGKTVMVFRCGESGLLYPADYVRNWGRLYGIGLGPHPVSESLQSEYEIDPPRITPAIEDIVQVMHPLRVSTAQMDLDYVTPEEADAKAPVIALADSNMKRRAPILYAKQLANPRGRLGLIRAAWAQLGR